MEINVEQMSNSTDIALKQTLIRNGIENRFITSESTTKKDIGVYLDGNLIEKTNLKEIFNLLKKNLEFENFKKDEELNELKIKNKILESENSFKAENYNLKINEQKFKIDFDHQLRNKLLEAIEIGDYEKANHLKSLIFKQEINEEKSFISKNNNDEEHDVNENNEIDYESNIRHVLTKLNDLNTKIRKNQGEIIFKSKNSCNCKFRNFKATHFHYIINWKIKTTLTTRLKNFKFITCRIKNESEMSKIIDKFSLEPFQV